MVPPLKVFLDANVLFPPMVRSLVLSVARTGAFEPCWSARVLEEWRRAVARQHGAHAAAEAELAARRMMEAFPGALAVAGEDLEATITLPDPADAHVVSAAVDAAADAILTFNLRDFPRHTLGVHGLVARHPDEFLWECLSRDPQPVAECIGNVLAAFDVPSDRARQALKRARLSRLGKAFSG